MRFARMCVEVVADDPLPNSVKVHVRGLNFVIPIEYSWKPKKYDRCMVYRHYSALCPHGPKKAWVPKMPQNLANNQLRWMFLNISPLPLPLQSQHKVLQIGFQY